jgi:regulator of sigma E protease
MQIILSILYFVIVLGILVFVHEFGHFLMARLSKMRVEVFALGMGFRLFGWNKKTGFTFGNLPENLELGEKTDYRISAFPIGGYCKISGMVDETFDTDFAAKAPEEWEYRAKNPFQKALSISGGVLFNILLAILIFAFIIFQNGENVYNTTKIGFVSENSIASFVGLQQNDEILAINKEKINNWNELQDKLIIDNLGKDLNILAKRNGTETSLFVDGKELTGIIAAETPLGFEPQEMKTIVVDVLENGLAKKNGISANDTIIAINEKNIASQHDFITELQTLKNQNVTLTFANKTGNFQKNLKLDETGMIGVQISSMYSGDYSTINYNVFQAIWKGTKQTFGTFGTIILTFKQIIVGNMEFKQAVGGPLMIAKQATIFAERGLHSFLYFTAMLSVSLALINILPFPALDGGHLLIIIIEAITKREIPIKAKLVVQQIGLFVLLAFMLYVIINDFQRIL